MRSRHKRRSVRQTQQIFRAVLPLSFVKSRSERKPCSIRALANEMNKLRGELRLRRQQFREALPGDHAYRFVIHDRDTIFSQRLDQEVRGLGVRVLRTPIRAPRANAVCERLGGSLRRECLDFLIPINERHLKMTVTE